LLEQQWQKTVGELQSTLDSLLAQEKAAHQSACESSENATRAEEKLAQIEQEQQQMEQLVGELRGQIVALAMEAAREAEARVVAESQLSQAKEEAALGAQASHEHVCALQAKIDDLECASRQLAVEREAMQGQLAEAKAQDVRERDTSLLRDATGTIERLKKELHDACAKV
jgi:hypothetical protein